MTRRFYAVVGGPDVPPADWQLATGHYVPAKMPPVIVHPRPDSETQSWERHRLAPAGIAWSIPIAVQGGAWPFRYTVNGPAGMTIGETYGSSGYGVLSWANPTVGTHSVTVNVYTQENGRNESGLGDSVSVSWTLEVAAQNDSRFSILNGGTLASVLDSTSAARQLFLRAGTYTTDSSAQFQLDGTRPSVIVGYPGEAVTISYTQRNFSISTSGAYIGGVDLADSSYGSSVANPRYFTTTGLVNRLTWFDVAMSNPSNGTSGTDNPTTVFFGDLGGTTPRDYIALVNCSETGRQSGASNSAGLSVMFACRNIVIEGCSFDGAAAQGFAFLKDSTSKATVRNNVVVGARLASGCQSLVPTASGDMEWCFNAVEYDVSSSSTSAIAFYWNVQNNSTAGKHWVYRNTIINDLAGRSIVAGLQSSTATAGPYYIESNVIQSPSSPRIATGTQVTVTTNVEGTSLVDVNRLLTSAALSAAGVSRGERGHEVA